MSWFDAPERNARDDAADVGRIVTIDDTVLIVLGRTGAGHWLLVPRNRWGTAAARRSVILVADLPSTLDAATRRVKDFARGGSSDRRGGWAR